MCLCVFGFFSLSRGKTMKIKQKKQTQCVFNNILLRINNKNYEKKNFSPFSLTKQKIMLYFFSFELSFFVSFFFDFLFFFLLWIRFWLFREFSCVMSVALSTAGSQHFFSSFSPCLTFISMSSCVTSNKCFLSSFFMHFVFSFFLLSSTNLCLWSTTDKYRTSHVNWCKALWTLWLSPN